MSSYQCFLKALHAKAVNSSEIPEEFCIENRFWSRNSGSRYNFSFKKSLDLTNFSQNAQRVLYITSVKALIFGANVMAMALILFWFFKREKYPFLKFYLNDGTNSQALP